MPRFLELLLRASASSVRVPAAVEWQPNPYALALNNAEDTEQVRFSRDVDGFAFG